MNTTHTSKTTRCWRAQAPALGRLIVFASLLAGSIVSALGDLDNGNFDKRPNTSWKIARLDAKTNDQGNLFPQRGTADPKVIDKTEKEKGYGQIGRDIAVGKDGKDDAVLYQDFQCSGKDAECQVTFDYVWQPVEGSGEYAAVFMARPDPNNAARYIGNWAIDFAEADKGRRISITGCGTPNVRIGFFIGGSTNGTQSTLLIENVTSTCVSVGSHGGAFSETMKGKELAAVPSGPVKTVLAVAPLGYSVLGNFLAAGGNTFGEVLAGARTGTQLFTWDSKAQNYSKYTYEADGTWQPLGGTLPPRGGAIFCNPGPAQVILALSGLDVPSQEKSRLPPGRYLVSTPGPEPADWFKLMGFLPALGDGMFKLDQLSPVLTPQTGSTYTYDVNGWHPSVPVVNPGEGVFVDVGGTNVITRDQLKLQPVVVSSRLVVGATVPVGKLPIGEIYLEAAEKATGPWARLNGVTTPFVPELNEKTKFFRLFMAP